MLFSTVHITHNVIQYTVCYSVHRMLFSTQYVIQYIDVVLVHSMLYST